MSRLRSLLPVAVVLVAPLVLTGCPKKRPQPAPASAPVTVTRPAAPAPAAPTEGDPVENPLDGELIAANEHAYRTGLLGDVYFDFDQATLREDARARLARNAEFLRSRPEFVVQVEGHCDERGTNDYNLALGERRAQAVREYLTQLGIAATRLRTVSFGEERPSCTQSDESCWQRNRRAHFLLVDRLPTN
jgi:peptidoglycan-associated lipoprotein